MSTASPTVLALDDTVRRALERYADSISPEIDAYDLNADDLRATARHLDALADLRSLTSADTIDVAQLTEHAEGLLQYRNAVCHQIGIDTVHRTLRADGNLDYGTSDDTDTDVARYDAEIGEQVDVVLGLRTVLHALGTRVV